MTRELRNEAVKILEGCKIEGSKIILPEGMIESAVFDIVRQTLEAEGGKWKKASNSFAFNHDIIEELAFAITTLQETACEDDVVFTPTETVEAEEEKTFKTAKDRRTLKYEFSAIELTELSKQLAEKTQSLEMLKEETKSVASQYSSRQKETSATINKLSNLVLGGYEMRDIECEVVFNKPDDGWKTIYRSDNGRQVTVERMDAHEFHLFHQPESEDLAR